MIPGLTPITGFKPFLSMWYDATEQILLETDKNKLSNDIQLFSILREVMLAPEKPTFIRSYKLKDFLNTNVPANLHKTNRDIAKITYNHTNRSYYYPYRRQNNPNTPSPILYFAIRDTKMFAISNQTSIRNNCVFQNTGTWDKPPYKIYTVSKDKFLTEIAKDQILHTVSGRIMNMVATNTRNSINLDTFQNLTQKMLQKLQEKQK